MLHVAKPVKHTFNGSYNFVKLLDTFFSNIGSKSILLEINFIKEKATCLNRKKGRLVTY